MMNQYPSGIYGVVPLEKPKGDNLFMMGPFPIKCFAVRGAKYAKLTIGEREFSVKVKRLDNSEVLFNLYDNDNCRASCLFYCDMNSAFKMAIKMMRQYVKTRSSGHGTGRHWFDKQVAKEEARHAHD